MAATVSSVLTRLEAEEERRAEGDEALAKRLSALETPRPVEPPTLPPPEPIPTPISGVTWGAWIDDGTGNFIWTKATWDKAESEFGKIPLVHFAHELKPSLSDLELAASRGGTPLVDWGMSGTVTCKSILAGTQDSALKGVNEAIGKFGKTVYFRPLWEMNGNWYSWGQSSEYIAAWKHIYALMTAPGCQMVWCPNYIFESQLGTASDPSRYFPGEAFVDYVACDVYVKAAAESATACFTPIYKLLRRLAPDKQIIGCEWGIDDSVGQARKAEEVMVMCRLWHSEGVYAHAYFQWNDGGNFRLSGKALENFNEHK